MIERMFVAEPQQLRQQVSADSPCGPNLEYDPRFVEMSRLAEGTREQQYGNTIVAAHPPDWHGALQIAKVLATETRDLRIAVMIIESLSHSNGLDGLADGLELLQSWTCDFWADIHPQLDQTDGNDPFVRINTLGRLCDPERLVSIISKMPLVEAPPHMSVTLTDVRRSNGQKTGTANADWATPMEIEAAFLALPLGELRHRYETSLRAENALIATIDFLEQTCGKGIWDASALVETVNHCTDALKGQLRRRLSASDAVVADVSATKSLRHDGAHDSSWVPHSVDQSISSISRIRVDSRDEAEQVIEAATQYFERYEPSSPVPLLLRRAKRMIRQDFVDILRDLAPSALEQAKTITGDFDE